MTNMYTGYFTLKEKEFCTICEEQEFSELCDKCGDVVCADTNCCFTYSLENSDTYVLCKICLSKINAKLRVEIDIGKISTLKQKIKDGTTYVSSSKRTLSQERRLSKLDAENANALIET
jgi:hypothetical protein|uniref:Uncharacterized protein n=1 Tax=viral metagenome TaxID=1070528 RepID=A0A6C0LWH4_9ZZZZ